jgi:SAM-dependent methyltransferase
MKHLSGADEVTALEPVESFHPFIRKSAEKAGISSKALTILPMGAEQFAEEYSDDKPFDWIILGNVLCEVPDITSTLQAVDRCLRKGGTVYFSEHMACPRGTWQRKYVQEFVNPWWRRASGGCNVNRDTLKKIETMPGWHVISWTYEHVRVGMGLFVLGLAEKQRD